MPAGRKNRRRPPERSRRRRHRAAIPVLVAVAVETAALWWRSGRLGGNIVVRCHAGHLYTTIWIPGVSLKSLRLGPWRVQYCPIGRHLALVAPVAEAKLSQEERRSASERHDLRLP